MGRTGRTWLGWTVGVLELEREWVDSVERGEIVDKEEARKESSTQVIYTRLIHQVAA